MTTDKDTTTLLSELLDAEQSREAMWKTLDNALFDNAICKSFNCNPIAHEEDAAIVANVYTQLSDIMTLKDQQLTRYNQIVMMVRLFVIIQYAPEEHQSALIESFKAICCNNYAISEVDFDAQVVSLKQAHVPIQKLQELAETHTNGITALDNNDASTTASIALLSYDKTKLRRIKELLKEEDRTQLAEWKEEISGNDGVSISALTRSIMHAEEVLEKLPNYINSILLRATEILALTDEIPTYWNKTRKRQRAVEQLKTKNEQLGLVINTVRQYVAPNPLIALEESLESVTEDVRRQMHVVGACFVLIQDRIQEILIPSDNISALLNARVEVVVRESSKDKKEESDRNVAPAPISEGEMQSIVTRVAELTEHVRMNNVNRQQNVGDTTAQPIDATDFSIHQYVLDRLRALGEDIKQLSEDGPPTNAVNALERAYQHRIDVLEAKVRQLQRDNETSNTTNQDKLENAMMQAEQALARLRESGDVDTGDRDVKSVSRADFDQLKREHALLKVQYRKLERNVEHTVRQDRKTQEMILSVVRRTIDVFAKKVVDKLDGLRDKIESSPLLVDWRNAVEPYLCRVEEAIHTHRVDFEALYQEWNRSVLEMQAVDDRAGNHAVDNERKLENIREKLSATIHHLRLDAEERNIMETFNEEVSPPTDAHNRNERAFYQEQLRDLRRKTNSQMHEISRLKGQFSQLLSTHRRLEVDYSERLGGVDQPTNGGGVGPATAAVANTVVVSKDDVTASDGFTGSSNGVTEDAAAGSSRWQEHIRRASQQNADVALTHSS